MARDTLKWHVLKVFKENPDFTSVQLAHTLSLRLNRKIGSGYVRATLSRNGLRLKNRNIRNW